MYKDQRLIPFIGGLAIGGLGGAAFNKNNYYPYNYSYPTYNYQYPYYNYPYQQNVYYPNQAIPYSYNQVNSMPIQQAYENNDLRSYNDMSYVPPYYR